MSRSNALHYLEKGATLQIDMEEDVLFMGASFSFS